MISTGNALAVDWSDKFCLYERLMGEAARRRAAEASLLSAQQIRQVEVVEVWGASQSDRGNFEMRVYDFGGRVIALAGSA